MYPGSQRQPAPCYGRAVDSGGVQKAGNPRCGGPPSAFTSSQQFQWMVRPSAAAGPAAGFYPRVYPYPDVGSVPGTTSGMRSGVICTIRPPIGGRRRKEEEMPGLMPQIQSIWLSPEEEERKRLRRERNKVAAAKCRNRRRELTDWLQAETEQLEDEKSSLQKEISELQKEKERLEFVLEAHQPICKMVDRPGVSSGLGAPGGGGAKVKGTMTKRPPSSSSSSSTKARPPDVSILPVSELETLHTPTLVKTPSITPFTASLAFTYPSVPLYGPEPSVSSSAPGLFSPPEPCSAAHRRGSSSGDQSSDSLGSPTLVTL